MVTCRDHLAGAEERRLRTICFRRSTGRLTSDRTDSGVHRLQEPTKASRHPLATLVIGSGDVQRTVYKPCKWPPQRIRAATGQFGIAPTVRQPFTTLEIGAGDLPRSVYSL